MRYTVLALAMVLRVWWTQPYVYVGFNTWTKKPDVKSGGVVLRMGENNLIVRDDKGHMWNVDPDSVKRSQWEEEAVSNESR